MASTRHYGAVSEQEERRTSLLQRFAENRPSFGTEGLNYKIIDGMPVKLATAEIAALIRRKNPKVRFLPSSCLYCYLDSSDPLNGLSVVYPNDMHITTQIGYGDVGVKSTSHRYYVRNGAFYNWTYRKRGGEHLNMKAAQSADKIAKAALPVLHPNSLELIVNSSQSRYLSAVKGRKSDASEDMCAALRKLMCLMADPGLNDHIVTRESANGALSMPLVSELLRAKEQGYTFKHPGVEESLDNLVQVHKESQEAFNDVSSARRPSAIVILQNQYWQEQPAASAAVVLRNVELRDGGGTELHGVTATPTRIDRMTDDEQAALFTLNMTETVGNYSDNFIDGVGFKASDRVFYLL